MKQAWSSVATDVSRWIGVFRSTVTHGPSTDSRRWLHMASLVFVAAVTISHAEVVLPCLLTDNMVVQRDVKLPVWGWATPGEKVTVRFNQQRKEVVTTPDGRWNVTLGPFKASGPHDLVITGRATLTITNVLVGDVWVCAGQSNMQHPMNQVIDSEKEIAAANHPNLRLFTVPMQIAGRPQDDVSARSWKVCHSNTIPAFSAVGYFFGRHLQQKLNVPIGLINCSWYGTSIIGWTSRRAFEANPVLRPVLDKFLKQVQEPYPAWEEKMGEYHRKQQQGDKGYPPFSDSAPTGIFNGMINPLTTFPIRGIIWYQGESDAPSPDRYRQQLPIVVSDWRKLWGEDFPFLYVQIAWCHWWGPHWARMCETQLQAASDIPYSAVVVINDLHDNYDQHPRLKQGVGDRLALAARAVVYGERKLPWQGPHYDSMKVEDHRVRLRFRNAEGGLVGKDPSALYGFTIAGEDRKFHGAQAVIEGNTIVAFCDHIGKPVAVRYNWGITNPVCALFNKYDLPMSSFRTDDWPLDGAK